MGSGGYIKTTYSINNQYEEYINNNNFIEENNIINENNNQIINENNNQIINTIDYENELYKDFINLLKDIKSSIYSYFMFTLKLFRLNYNNI
jgi:hypothetical protein